MKLRKTASNLLILLEVILLAIVLIFGGVRYVTGPEKTTGQYKPNDNGDRDNQISLEEQNQTEQTETEQPSGEAMDPLTDFAPEIVSEVQAMSTEEKVAQLFLTSPESLTGNSQVTIAGEGTRAALEQYPVSGLVYTKNTYQGRTQFGALLSGAQRYSVAGSGRYLLLAAAGTGADQTEAFAFSAVYDTAPLTNLLAASSMQGDEEKILYPVNFPDGAEDVSENTAYVRLQHIVDESLTGDGDNPCSLSADAVRYLRNKKHYQGVIVTADLSDAYITDLYPENGDAAVQAVLAGADLICQTDEFIGAYAKVLAAVEDGTISMQRVEEAVCRVLTAKDAMPAPTAGDIIADNANRTQAAADNTQIGADQTADNQNDNQLAEQDNNQPEADNQEEQTPNEQQQ